MLALPMSREKPEIVSRTESSLVRSAPTSKSPLNEQRECWWRIYMTNRLLQTTILLLALAGVHYSAVAADCSQTQVVVPTNGTDIDRGNALRRILESSPGCQAIMLGAATFEVQPVLHEPGAGNDAIWITASDLTIQGSGVNSIVRFSRPTYLGFVVRYGVHNLTISNIAIRGSLVPGEEIRRMYAPGSDTIPCDPTGDPNQCFTGVTGSYPNTHGIANYGGITDVSNVMLVNLDLRDLAVGMNIGGADGTGACGVATYNNVTIANNNIAQMYGRDSGSGYGIDSSCAENVLIIDNVISNTGRHAIYQSKSRPSGTSLADIRILRNTVIDHGDVNGTLADPNRSAIVVARSNNATVAGNTIIASHRPGISVESDGALLAQNNAIIGNHFIDAVGDTPNVWINTAGPSVILWGNVLNSVPTGNGVLSIRWNVQSGTTDDPLFWTAGIGTQWIEFSGTANLDIAHAGELSADAKLVLMQNNALHQVTPVWGTHPGTSGTNSWSYSYSTTDWSYGAGFQAMALAGSAIYVIQNNTLHRVIPGAGGTLWPYIYSSTWWAPAFTGFGAIDDQNIHVLQNGVLHHVSPASNGTAWPYFYAVVPGSALRTAGGVSYVRSGASVLEYSSNLTYLGQIN